MAIPYADPTSTGQWAADLLTELGAPVNAHDVGYVEAWENVESKSGYGYNPLGEETTAPGSTDANSHGVQAYTSWSQGLSTTVSNLTSLSRNAPLVAALRKGNASYATLAKAQEEGGWSGGEESSITGPGTSELFTYGGSMGEQKGASGVSGSTGTPNPTGWFGQWIEPVLQNPIPLPGLTKLPGGATTPGGGVISDAANVPGGIASGILGPVMKWIEEGAADITFIGFGLLLVLIGLSITFKGEEEEAAPVAAAAAA